MEIVIKDCFFGQTYTIGKMYINGNYICDTLEDKCREKNNDGNTIGFKLRKIYGKTAIPAGTYEVILSMSNRFKIELPLLVGVLWFEGIRIHSGNTEFDTDGCVLVGYNSEKGKVLKSRITMFMLVRKIKKALKNNEKITCTIVR